MLNNQRKCWQSVTECQMVKRDRLQWKKVKFDRMPNGTAWPSATKNGKVLPNAKQLKEVRMVWPNAKQLEEVKPHQRKKSIRCPFSTGNTRKQIGKRKQEKRQEAKACRKEPGLRRQRVGYLQNTLRDNVGHLKNTRASAVYTMTFAEKKNNLAEKTIYIFVWKESCWKNNRWLFMKKKKMLRGSV